MKVALTKLRRTSVDAHPEDVWSAKVIRPLSCYPTWLFLKLGITANQTTVVNFFVGLAGCVIIACGHFIIGALLLNLNYLLDRVDGNIAKSTDTCTELGRLLDGFSDLLLGMLFPISIGVGLYFHPQFGVAGEVYLLSGFAFSGFRLLRSRYTAYVSIATGGDTFSLIKKSNSLLVRLGLIVVFTEPIVMLGFAVAGALSIFLLGYTVLALCELIVYAALAIKQARGGRNVTR